MRSRPKFPKLSNDKLHDVHNGPNERTGDLQMRLQVSWSLAIITASPQARAEVARRGVWVRQGVLIAECVVGVVTLPHSQIIVAQVNFEGT